MKYKKFLGAASTALMIATIVILMLAPVAWAQSKYKTLYKFKGGKDGSGPAAGLISDPVGNLYGTTQYGGAHKGGTVFKLTPGSQGDWTESVLYSFCSQTNCIDGANPVGGLIFDASGNLYGTASNGGTVDEFGVVFMLAPNTDGSWTESVLYDFNEWGGAHPTASLLFDSAGNLYGTTVSGGWGCFCGVLFELMPNGDGSWTESVLHDFSQTNPHFPYGLISDAAGNLYGTTKAPQEGWGAGTVFQMKRNSNGGWTYSDIFGFSNQNYSDGAYPQAGVILDTMGNLYGTTTGGGTPNSGCETKSGCGTVFQLTRGSYGNWRERMLHRFKGGVVDGYYPVSGLVLDTVGNLYGTTASGGSSGYGIVYELAAQPGGGWRYRVLFSFLDKPGANPQADLILDGAGNLYGTTYGDGSKTFGSVFEITP